MVSAVSRLLRSDSNGLMLVFVTMLLLTACDTADSRRQVTAYIRNLGAQVKASPNAPAGKAAMDKLLEILKTDNSSFARCQVCYTLDSLGSLSAPAVPTLMEVAQSDDGFVRQDAIRGLRNIGPPAAKAVDLLIEIVDSANSRKETSLLRILYAIEGLGNIGEAAFKAIPALEVTSSLSDEMIAERAKEALNKLKRVRRSKEKEGSRPKELSAGETEKGSGLNGT